MNKLAANMLRKVPLIVILGSTGTGKTKLSLELAERFGGEIISADSMQVYANLDIVTAKATQEERSRAKHHLLDVASPAEPFTVVHFRNKALPIIEGLLGQAKCPIVVGGTNYYIESLLWDILVSPTTSDNAKESTSSAAATSVKNDEDSFGEDDDEFATGKYVADSVSGNEKHSLQLNAAQLSEMSSELLHSHLRKIDPESANRMHPNNKRKIVRAIEYLQQTGRTLSSKIKEQRQQPGGNRLGGPLRYPHTLLFWLRCKQDVLNERLDKRVDGMLEQGLLREVRAFYDEHLSDKSAANPYTKGVLQTIGFKEFIPYLEKFDAVNDQKIEEYLSANAYKMPSEEHFKRAARTESSLDDPTSTKLLPPGLEVLKACLDELRLVTRRYSRKQIKWINNRFLSSKDRQVPPLYALDTSDISLWREVVFRRAETVIDCYRNGQVCEVEPLSKLEHPHANMEEETSHYCDTCQRHFIGEYQWQLHMRGNKHKRRKEGLKRRAKLAAEQVEVPTDT